MFAFCTMNKERAVDKSKKAEELLLKIAQGDMDAVGELYDLIKTDVYAFALSKIKNKTDAEDIMQETFVRVFKHAKQYNPSGKPMAWIITIEINLIRRFFQLSSRTTALNDAVYSENHDCKSEAEIVDSVFVRNLISTLGDEDREIIVLHLVVGLKHREIAKILGKPLSTVLSKYNRALKKLKRDV
ncbi:MAG: RNA polymerase sigma factor [Clostridia bacterium]|nr:RNA polymerase sigma factor [Clostridia bacterium]